MSVGQLVEWGTGEVVPLGHEPVTLGRQEDNSVVLADAQVSRHHAEITLHGGRCVLRDLGSANGTYVNGKRIAEAYMLSHGDLVRLGQTSFKVVLSRVSAQQDTLVDIPVPAAVAPTAQPGKPWLAIGLGIAVVVAVLLVGTLLVWSRIQRGEDTGQATPVTEATAVSAGASRTRPATRPTDIVPTAEPSDTAVPTLSLPTTQPTIQAPTAAPPAEVATTMPKPVIGYFRSDRLTLEPGQCARLEWGHLGNVNGASLTEVGQVNFSGKVDVCLDTTKTFSLKAVGAGGTTEESILITVQEPVGPGIEYFRVVPSIINPGACSQLEWGKVERALSAEIEPGVGPVGTPGNKQVCPSGTTTYVLTAQNPEASSTARTTLIVSEEAAQTPVIAFFTAKPANIRAGECTTLSWGKVDYASTVTIDQGIGGVATPGSQEFCLGSTTSFVMTAEGPGGRSEANLTIAVTPGERAELPDLVIESITFEPNPCYRGQRCRVRVKARNDGLVDSGHFVVHWAPSGEESVPVEWDVDSLAAGGEKELTYLWIPSRVDEKWWTLAIADLHGQVAEIEEGTANVLEQYVTVLEP